MASGPTFTPSASGSQSTETPTSAIQNRKWYLDCIERNHPNLPFRGQSNLKTMTTLIRSHEAGASASDFLFQLVIYMQYTLAMMTSDRPASFAADSYLTPWPMIIRRPSKFSSVGASITSDVSKFYMLKKIGSFFSLCRHDFTLIRSLQTLAGEARRFITSSKTVYPTIWSQITP